jgi:hypothetical protein
MKEVKPLIPSDLIDSNCLNWPTLSIIHNLPTLMDDLYFGIIMMNMDSKYHRIVILCPNPSSGTVTIESGRYFLSTPIQSLQETGFSLRGSPP